MKLSHQDELLLQRHLDGELDAAASAALRARLAAEPELAKGLDEARALRTGFLVGRATAMRPSASFTGKVLAAARQLPSRRELEQADVAERAMRVCRRILLAAALLAGVGLLWQFGAARSGGSGQLQAVPDEAQRVIDELDAKAQSLAPPRVESNRGK